MLNDNCKFLMGGIDVQNLGNYDSFSYHDYGFYLFLGFGFVTQGRLVVVLRRPWVVQEPGVHQIRCLSGPWAPLRPLDGGVLIRNADKGFHLGFLDIKPQHLDR